MRAKSETNEMGRKKGAGMCLSAENVVSCAKRVHAGRAYRRVKIYVYCIWETESERHSLREQRESMSEVNIELEDLYLLLLATQTTYFPCVAEPPILYHLIWFVLLIKATLIAVATAYSAGIRVSMRSAASSHAPPR